MMRPPTRRGFGLRLRNQCYDIVIEKRFASRSIPALGLCVSFRAVMRLLSGGEARAFPGNADKLGGEVLAW